MNNVNKQEAESMFKENIEINLKHQVQVCKKVEIRTLAAKTLGVIVQIIRRTRTN